MNFSDENKGDLTVVPTMKLADPVEINSSYLYHAALISGDKKSNRKARKIESIREKFEKISATSCILPLKELNKIRSRRNSGLSVVNTESRGRETELVGKAKHNEVFEVERNEEDIELAGLKSTIGLSEKLLLHDDKLISSKFSSVSGVSSSSDIEEVSDTTKTDDESGVGPLKEAQFQFEVISSSCATCTASSTASNISVEMSAKKKSEENGLQEVHRLLKKFTIIREQRAKKRLYQDLTDKTDDHSGTMDNSDLLMQYVFRVPVPHLYSPSNSNLHLLYAEKKDRLKKTNLSKGISLLESVPSEVQAIFQEPHSGIPSFLIPSNANSSNFRFRH
uniref:Uncharacterized protein n=1 Tax=Setaria digitata TaxID=48799 RepID=A0A915PED3_9BILA